MPPIVRTPDPKAQLALGKSQMADIQNKRLHIGRSAATRSYRISSRRLVTECAWTYTQEGKLSLLGEAKQMRLKSQDGSFDRNYVDGEAGSLEQKVFYS